MMIAVILCVGLLASVTTSAKAAAVFPDELYMEESRAHVCTLTSAAMLVRSTLFVNGSTYWSEVTEADVEAVAWIPGAGLRYEFTFDEPYATISVGHTDVSGISEADLAALLEEHPEGIVLYCGRLPHAVFLTDYADGMFYVADPAPYYAEGRIPLTEGWIGKCYGHDLDKILSSVTAYWSVTDAHVVSDAEAISLDTLSLGGAEAHAVENAKTLIAVEKAAVNSIVEALTV